MITSHRKPHLCDYALRRIPLRLCSTSVGPKGRVCSVVMMMVVSLANGERPARGKARAWEPGSADRVDPPCHRTRTLAPAPSTGSECVPGVGTTVVRHAFARQQWRAQKYNL